MFRRVLNTTVRATLTLFLRDFFENVTSQNFEDLRVGTSIHVVLRNLAIKRAIADEILKTTPFKLLHAGLDRLQAELTLNTKQARKLLLQEVLAVLEFDPDWVPPPPTNDAPPPIPTGISGAAAIVYSANTGEVLEDSFLRDDMKAILSKRNFNEEEAIKMPEDEVDQSASAVAALLKELVHHSEVAIDGFTVRIRFPPSKKTREENKNATTNEVLIRFPSIFVRDKTVFDGRPSDHFSKFISIAPPIIQIYALSQEEVDTPPSATDRELSYEDTLAMGYGFLHASAEMERLREENNNNKDADKNTSDNSNNDKAAVEVDGMDFHTIMESQRCVTIEIVRRPLQPRVPTWDVKISTTPFLLCARPYQIGLLLDIGHRLAAQSKLQEKTLREREQDFEKLAEAAREKERQESANFPRNFYNNNTLNNNNSGTNANDNNKTSHNSGKNSGAPPTTFLITAKCQHGVLALFSHDDVEAIRNCWESIEDFGSFISAEDENNNNNLLPRCLSNQPGYFALSAGSGKIVLEKNNSKNSIFFKNNNNNNDSNNSNSNKKSKKASDDDDDNDDNNNETQQNENFASEMENFLDRYTETTFTASLGSLVFVERASTDQNISAVKIIEVGNTKKNENNNNNNNHQQGTIAGEIIFKITEAVPFHELLKYKCINLTGVRYRHPTKSETYSQALLNSTVTIKDLVVNSNGTSIIRLEPTVLSRVVDLMNYINTKVIKDAMERNLVPLPKLKDIIANNNNNNENKSSQIQLQQQQQQVATEVEQPFNDEAMTVSMNFKEVDIQCLLLKSRMPAPDIWGPLTCRLLDHLADFSSSTATPSNKNHLLPRCFVIRGKNVNFTTCPATEPTLAQLTITSAEALIQQENGASRVLLRISPSDKIPQFTLNASVKSNPFGVSDVTKLDKIARDLSQRPTVDQDPIIREKLIKELSSVAVDIKIPLVRGVTDILMDDMIFVLFCVTELSEISIPLARYIPLDETAAYVASKAFVANSVTAVNLVLEEIKLFIGAPRLDKHGVCLGDPLSSLLPAEQAPRNLSFALHRYELRATQLTLTMGLAAVAQFTQHWGLALGLGGLSLREHLIQLDGHPGAVHILCDSFADAHRRSYEGDAERRRGRSGRVFNLTLIRDVCYRRRSDLMQIGIVLECVSVVQQASYAGDAWPAVLAFWSADTPVNVKAGQKVHSRGAIQQSDVVPISSAITVNVVAKDILLDWKAEMRKERVAVLISAIEVEIPELVTGDPKLTAFVRMPETTALLLHNDFPTPIIEFDRAMFVSGVNIFGSTRKGALEDLQYLGFAQLCTVGPKPTSIINNHNNNNGIPASSSSSSSTSSTAAAKTPTIVVRKSHPGSNRKVQLEVHHFFTEFSFAPDSCALFIAFIEHIQDAKYIKQCVTPPLRLVRRAGGLHFSRVVPTMQEIEEAPAQAYVQDFDLIDELQGFPSRSNSMSNDGTDVASTKSRGTSTAIIARRRKNDEKYHQLLKRTQDAINHDDSSNNKKNHREDDDDDFNESEWDLPELDERGREKANAFTFRPNVAKNNQQQQQSSALTLAELMSDLYYFQPPIHDESAIAEPLFNVPSKVEFELLLHTCDFKVSFFGGSDFEMMNSLLGKKEEENNNNNKNNNNNNNNNNSRYFDPTSSEMFTDFDSSVSHHRNNDDQGEYDTVTQKNDLDDASSFHSIHTTVPMFDVIQRRQRRRKTRNSSECVALWLMHCFTQIDIFPSLASTLLQDEEEAEGDEENNNNNNNGNDDQEINQPKKTKKKIREFIPIRQIIFRAGEIEVEDLVHESPVRKMLYCALPKSQRDAPVVTLRLRTLQKDVGDDDDDHDEDGKNENLHQAPASTTSFMDGQQQNNSQTFEALMQKKIFQKIESQQVSLRLLPLGINISARTVMKVVAAFVNMNETKVALTNQQPLPSIASAASSLASFTRTQHSGISSIRPYDIASNFNSLADERRQGSDSNTSVTNNHSQSHDTSNHQNNNNSSKNNNNNNNDDNGPKITAPPTFFDKLIIHPLDLRISWFPDESLYSDKQVADALGSQWLLYIVRYMAIEGARLSLTRISLSSVKMEEVSERLIFEAWPQLKSSKLLFLLAGLQPVRPAAEIAGALGDLVLTPLEYWQHQRSIFVGIARGIQTCTSRLAAESLTLTATGTRLGQHAALALSKGIQRNPTPLLWGNQPQTVGEGAVRALKSAEKGLLDFGSGVAFCVDEMKQSSVSSGLMRLPLSLLIPVEGILRGMTEAILGVRNTIRPEERHRDTQEFKSTVFSHKRGNSDDDDDDE